MDGTDASVVADNTLTITGGNLVAASVDSIAEFESASQNYSADTKGSAGYVNIITKSGTNKFHGDAFEYFRNSVFDARTFFAPEKEQLNLNDFGTTITGPIKHNKNFLHGGAGKNNAFIDPLLRLLLSRRAPSTPPRWTTRSLAKSSRRRRFPPSRFQAIRTWVPSQALL